MLSPTEKLIFALLVIIAFAAAWNTFGEMIAIIGRGKDKLHYDNFFNRVQKGMTAMFTQGEIIRHRKFSSTLHLGVAWGFIFYFLVNGIDIAEGLVEDFSFFEGNIIGDLFRLFADVFGFMVLVGVLWFIIRRFALKDPVLVTRENVMLNAHARDGSIHKDSLVVAIFILFHVGFRMMASSSILVMHGHGFSFWEPFASTLASVFGMAQWSGAGLLFMWHFSWWTAVGLVILFIPYFPSTKHAHLFMGPFNYMTRPDRTYLGQPFGLDFEDESIEQFGANTLFDLSQTQLVDAYACIMCNRCQEVCPAYNTGKELSPSAIEINKRYYVKENGASLANGGESVPLMEFMLSQSAVWACTSCGHCIEVCPVGNTPMLDILDMRRDNVLMESAPFPSELKGAFVGMERSGNPWGSTEGRMEWAAPLDFPVPTVSENPDYEYLFWVGCAGAFNPESQKTARAVATILHEAGVSFAVLGEAESCTGDSARRAGNEYLYFELATGNIATLDAANANERKIVTSCPHCLTTIGKEYGELGGNYKTYHHTQLIADLIGQGKLQLKGNALEKVTFHDPCYLGRHNGIIDAPRSVLANAGATLLEMDRNGRDSFCCGAGGAQMWKEEEEGDESVSMVRFDEARQTGAETVAVGCPFCGTMMHDANQENGSPMQVKDIAEIVMEAL